MDAEEIPLKPLDEDLVPQPQEIKLVPIASTPFRDDEDTDEDKVYRFLEPDKPKPKPKIVKHRPVWIITGRNFRDALLCAAVSGAPCLLMRHPVPMFITIAFFAFLIGFVWSVRRTQPEPKARRPEPLDWRNVDFRG